MEIMVPLRLASNTVLLTASDENMPSSQRYDTIKLFKQDCSHMWKVQRAGLTLLA